MASLYLPQARRAVKDPPRSPPIHIIPLAVDDRRRPQRPPAPWQQLLNTVWPAVTRALARFPAVHLAAYLLLDGTFVTMSQRLLQLQPVRSRTADCVEL